MVHLKSTLAVSAVMLAGLVAASPYPYRQAEETRPTRSAAAPHLALVTQAEASPAATAWTDPPARLPAATEAPASATAPVTAAPVEQTASVVPPVTPAPSHQIAAQAKVEQAHRRKVAKAAARQRLAAARARAGAAAQAQVTSSPASNNASRIDPIGDILRGLGIAKEG